MSNKILIAYHANCIDGFTSAWVTQGALVRAGYVCSLIPMNYDADSDLELMGLLSSVNFARLYVVDFSLSIEMLESLTNNFPSLFTTILDHHKTAFERYFPNYIVSLLSKREKHEGNAHIILDNGKSGASLCYTHFYGMEVPLPKLIAYVEDYDLWRFRLGETTKWINKYIGTHEMTLDVWDSLAERLDDTEGLNYAVEAGKRLQAERDEEVHSIAQKAVNITIQNVIGLAVECPYKLASEVGHVLATRSGTFGAMYQTDVQKREVKWSLRSNGDFDVSAMAKNEGGGGHKNAAGFTKELFADDRTEELSDD